MSQVRFLTGIIYPGGDSFAGNDFQTFTVGVVVNLNQDVQSRGDVRWGNTITMEPR
jgi:hypothetical protein